MKFTMEGFMAFWRDTVYWPIWRWLHGYKMPWKK